MTYYTAIHTDQIVIDGIGTSKQAAWDDVVDGIGIFFDSDGADITPDQARDKWVITPCTNALYSQVETEGGGISWGYLPDGTACTDDEEENGQ